MAATTTTSFPIPDSASVASADRERSNRRRLITPEAGRALEILAHAIEYLDDELAYQGLTSSAKKEQLEAMRILMELNRQIYFACPEVPGFGERCRTFLFHRHSA